MAAVNISSVSENGTSNNAQAGTVAADISLADVWEFDPNLWLEKSIISPLFEQQSHVTSDKISDETNDTRMYDPVRKLRSIGGDSNTSSHPPPIRFHRRTPRGVF